MPVTTSTARPAGWKGTRGEWYVVIQVALILADGLWLGKNATPLPHPRAGAPLVDSGPFRLVRHPMYSGGVFFAFGWALYVRGPLTLVYAVALLVFADIKARREEQWLREAFPGYDAYERRVRKLIPFVY